MSYSIVDEGSFAEADEAPVSRDPLAFPGYRDALAGAGSGRESVTCGAATVRGHVVEVASFDFSFMGGSMGEAAGERLARSLERAAERRVPFLLHTRTGGARMQEGMRSLVQMPKVVVARAAAASAGTPFIAVLGNPTTGGVLASIAGLADVTLAEAGATVGFAGPRVAAQVLGRPLTGETHTAEAALGHGLVDAVVPAAGMSGAVARILEILAPSRDDPVHASGAAATAPPADGWEAVQAARASSRPLAPDLLRDAADAAVELRGDRAGADDPAVRSFLARVAGRPLVALTLDRTHLPGPAAYRKARRCVALASRLRLPVVTLVDTPGADPSETSEAGGIAWEIAGLFDALLSVPVPVVALVTGEGGSGGALAFSAGDVLLVYSDAVFSVIGPEAAAQILWRDGGRAPEAARLLRLRAQDLADLRIVDGVVPGPLDAGSVRETIAYHLRRLNEEGARGADLVERRRRLWRTRDGH